MMNVEVQNTSPFIIGIFNGLITPTVMYNRRSFLKATGTLASGLLVGRSAFSMDDLSTKGAIKQF
jgi:hypothetical protein